MLCVACGQLTSGDYTAPCELCGRMQIVGGRYILVHMVSLVGHVRTYNGIRLEDQAPVTCTLWRVPETISNESLEETIQAVRQTDTFSGCIGIEDWFLLDGNQQVLVDIRDRADRVWLSPTEEGELWELETVRDWVDSLAALAIGLHENSEGPTQPCFRVGRLMLDRTHRRVLSVDPGMLRARIYGDLEAPEVQIPVLQRLNLEAFWHSWAATVIQLLGGMSIYGLHLLDQAMRDLEQNTLLDLMEGVLDDKKSRAGETNIYRLDAMRNLLIDCASRFGPRAPRLAHAAVETWVSTPTANRATVGEKTAVVQAVGVEKPEPEPGQRVESDELEDAQTEESQIDEPDSILEEQQPEPLAITPTIVPAVLPSDRQPVNLRKIHAERETVRRRKKYQRNADYLLAFGACLLFLGWPIVAWQWSFGRETSIVDLSSERVALTSVWKQLHLNADIHKCMNAEPGSAMITLYWRGMARPKAAVRTVSGVHDAKMTDCLTLVLEESTLRWPNPMSGRHETTVAWE